MHGFACTRYPTEVNVNVAQRGMLVRHILVPPLILRSGMVASVADIDITGSRNHSFQLSAVRNLGDHLITKRLMAHTCPQSRLREFESVALDQLVVTTVLVLNQHLWQRRHLPNDMAFVQMRNVRSGFETTGRKGMDGLTAYSERSARAVAWLTSQIGSDRAAVPGMLSKDKGVLHIPTKYLRQLLERCEHPKPIAIEHIGGRLSLVHLIKI